MSARASSTLVNQHNGALQASNVATYIAHGDVALSVLMTTASTLGAIVMTPLLTKLLAGALVAVDAKVRSVPCLRLRAEPQVHGLPHVMLDRSLSLCGSLFVCNACWLPYVPCLLMLPSDFTARPPSLLSHAML